MEDKRDFLDEFSLAFIEELQQDGSAFKFPLDEKFIENEFPHYANKFEHAMKNIYKLWQTDTENLSKIKEQLITKIGQSLSDKINNDKFLRFIILKTFHDSQIESLQYNNEQGTLQLQINYDDAFCKIPYEKNLILMFNGVENYNADITNDTDCCLIISEYWYEIENDRVKLDIEGMDVNQEWKEFKISFIYNTAKIN